jgi:hypothetical protein
MQCWAVASAIMLSWHEGNLVTPEEAVIRAGSAPDRERYLDKYRRNLPLSERHQEHYFQSLGMVAEPPMSLAVEGLLDLLRRYGPLWIQNDDTPEDLRDLNSTHFRIIYGMYSDGTPASTFLRIMDPARGPVTKSLSTFITKYERLAFEAGDRPLLIQLVHFP